MFKSIKEGAKTMMGDMRQAKTILEKSTVALPKTMARINRRKGMAIARSKKK
jgi:hypothetical protein